MILESTRHTLKINKTKNDTIHTRFAVPLVFFNMKGLYQTCIEGLDHHLPDRDVANAINSAFLDQMKSFSPLDAIPPFEANSAVVTISEVDVLTAIRKLNPRKAAGPDGIPSWVFREYADFIAQPVTSILNCSFASPILEAGGCGIHS